MQKVLLSDLDVLAKQVLQRLSPKSYATVVALSGKLGAGKTTFVQALGKELGITEIMQSPTYVLMKKYQITNSKFQTLIHIDAYRLEKPEEFKALKPNRFLNDPKVLVAVEWPERLGNALPKPDLTINFSSDLPGSNAGSVREGERYIEVI